MTTNAGVSAPGGYSVAPMLPRLPRIIAIVALSASLTAGGCSRGRASPGAPLHVEAEQTTPSAPVPMSERRRRCEGQAARLAADGLWRRGSPGGGDDRPLHWVAHYSEKYDQCYVVIDRRGQVHDGAQPIVSELWEAFDATVLASHTNDPRASIRRSLCQVDLSDNPFTSCAVSKYFIDEHLAH
jgi:hypothetical protein